MEHTKDGQMLRERRWYWVDRVWESYGYGGLKPIEAIFGTVVAPSRRA